MTDKTRIFVEDECGLRMTVTGYVWAICLTSAASGALIVIAFYAAADGLPIGAVLLLLAAALGIWSGPYKGAAALEVALRERGE